MAKEKAKKNKKSLFTSIKNFFIDVKKEAGKVMWPSKKVLLKYSVVTLVFMLFICLFFVGTDLIIALISYVKELIG